MPRYGDPVGGVLACLLGHVAFRAITGILYGYVDLDGGSRLTLRR